MDFFSLMGPPAYYASIDLGPWGGHPIKISTSAGHPYLFKQGLLLEWRLKIGSHSQFYSFLYQNPYIFHSIHRNTIHYFIIPYHHHHHHHYYYYYYYLICDLNEPGCPPPKHVLMQASTSIFIRTLRKAPQF
jgi:hypothetical protein